ncbi:MAG TPA: HDOD domain-containing protein [Clostridiaceae bacterium]
MDAFVARQPIFDKNENVVAYELLFRYGVNNYYENLNGDSATSDVITNAFFIIGVDKLTFGKRAYINFTENLLRNETASLLPKECIAVEILENILPDLSLTKALKKLKKSGYTLVLDDFIFNKEYLPFIELADIIKVDFLITTGEDRKRIINLVGNKKIKFLAEKVETIEDYKQAKELGYSYFQGYFFSKPLIVSRKTIFSTKFAYIQLLKELYKEDIEFSEIEDIVKKDVSLSFKLLKYINSASLGMKKEISSIRNALVLLGKKEVVKWLSLMTLKALSSNKPEELQVLSIVRGRFCELLAPKVGLSESASSVFLMGMFSVIDTILDRPMIEILMELNISFEIQVALLGGDNRFKKLYDLVLSYEQADWSNFSALAKELDLDENEVPILYLKSLEWSKNLLVN